MKTKVRIWAEQQLAALEADIARLDPNNREHAVVLESLRRSVNLLTTDPEEYLRQQQPYLRQRAIDQARKVAEQRYFQLLARVVTAEAEGPGYCYPDDLLAAAAAVGRKPEEIPLDLEDCAAQMEDRAEQQRADRQRTKLEKQIADQRCQLQEALGQLNTAKDRCLGLEQQIAAIYAMTALRQKGQLVFAEQRQRSAAQVVQQHQQKIEALQAQAGDIRADTGHRERLRCKRIEQKGKQRQADSDRAMRIYAQAQAQDSLPDRLISAAISPGTPAGSKKIAMGRINGEPVFAVGRLG